MRQYRHALLLLLLLLPLERSAPTKRRYGFSSRDDGAVVSQHAMTLSLAAEAGR